MLVNGDFEGGAWRRTHTGQEFGEIMAPEGWTCFWREGGAPLPHDPANVQGYRRPECKLIARVPPYLDPPRVARGTQAWQCFTFYGIHDAGLYQQVQVAPGTRLRLSALAHAWSSQGDDPHASEGVGTGAFFARAGTVTDDSLRNFTFRVGIDPTGGVDPWGAGVVWGPGAHIYNAYAAIPAAEAVAAGPVVTVFLRSEVLWPFKHCDAVFDGVTLEALDVALPVRPRGAPRIPYARRVNVIPPGATEARAVEIFRHGWRAARETASGSYDDAGVGDLEARTAVLWDLPTGEQGRYRAWYAEHYPGVGVEFAGESGEAETGALTLGYPSTFLPPVITSPYGPRSQGFHYGLDLRSSWARWGTEALAALDGEVALVGVEPDKAYFGEQVQIRARHGADEVLLRYAHLVPGAQGGIYVQVGQRVERGQKVGRPDNTGVSTADHLHIDVRINGRYVDPAPLIVWPGAEPPPPEPEPGALLGLHLQDLGPGTSAPGTAGPGAAPTGTAALDFVAAAQPRVMKIFDPGMAPAIRARCAGTAIVYRHHLDRAMELACLTEPEGYAAWFLDRFAGQVAPYVERGEITHIETAINETMDGDRVVAAVAFELAFIAALQRRLPGARPVVATVAVGNPREEQYPLLLPLAEVTAGAGGAFGYHAYWPVERGVSGLVSDWAWHAGRFEGMDALFRARGVAVEWILSECGPCGGVRQGGHFAYDPAAGWRHPQCYGGDFGRVCEDLRVFVRRLAASPARVRGATWFTVCGWDWGDFTLGVEELGALGRLQGEGEF